MTQDNFIPTAAQDVVGVFTQDSATQLFVKARPLKAKVTTLANVMKHPVEDGTTVTDHKVIMPTEIELSMILSSDDYKSVFQSIKEAFEKSTLLTVQTRAGTYPSMIISAMPHDEDAALYDAIALSLKLSEVKFATFTTGAISAPVDKRDTKTSNGGKKQGKEKSQSVAKSIQDGVMAWLN